MQNLDWWKTGVIYQIYPRSFADSNGDGVGDLPGITQKLDYLSWLGIDAVWLSPFFPSPMKDFGYDVSDYLGVDRIFGTLEDFDEMLTEAHRRSIRVIIDLVPNHTSDEHEWFIESRSSRDNPKRDWYVWRDPKPDGSPPNNWESIHGGGSAWEFDRATGQFYLHTFQTEQPDLDWQNPEVREAIFDVMRFWLARGVDGFRIDALPCVAKDALLRDNPVNPDWREGLPLGMRQRRVNSEDGEEILEIVRQMRAVVDEYDGERVLIGEAYLPLERLMQYYGKALDGLQLPYNFGLLEVPEWSAKYVNEAVNRYEAALPEGTTGNWVLGNHDNPRAASRVGEERARAAQMLLLTLRGTPTIYYGDELGMTDTPIMPEEIRDPQGIQDPDYNRDPARTPMQWDDSEGAGFSEAKPWLPVSDVAETNVASQSEDPRSMLSMVRELLRIRKDFPALNSGSYTPLETGNEDIYAYLRHHEEERILVAINLGHEPATLKPPQDSAAELLYSTQTDRNEENEKTPRHTIELSPNEGAIYTLGKPPKA